MPEITLGRPSDVNTVLGTRIVVDGLLTSYFIATICAGTAVLLPALSTAWTSTVYCLLAIQAGAGSDHGLVPTALR